jgi:multiple sugar transport system ATP-binding protein
MTQLAVSDLAKTFDETTALDGVGFEVAERELFCVVGPTNAGKSTLLKTVAGLVRPDRGRVMIAGRDMTTAEPRARGVSLLFQNMALFPTLSGFDNIAFPLRTAGLDAAAVKARVHEVAEILKVTHVLDRLPRTFSGGEQQRVAIGRAIAQPCQLLMLDEPLTNLDARIRISLRIEFKALHRDTGQTILYVTHDQVEAMSLSDRIAVLNRGRFEQVGTPEDVYHRPETDFVARFIGTPPMNLLPAELSTDDEVPTLAGAGFRVALPGANRLASYDRLPRRLSLGVRPERIRVAPDEAPETPFKGEVQWVEHLGAKSILDATLGDTRVKAVVPADHAVRQRGPAWFGFEPDPNHLMDPQSGRFFR